ncbi:MAG: DUF1592 domain-containing protein [Deltaproteobacteria bacterium]|nr:DUF1592 domain-containing protein [Deltaproteobacteria bacterium]
MLGRLVHDDELRRMPQGGAWWSDADINAVRAFVCEVARAEETPRVCDGELDPGAPVIARLTRDEYNRTIRDLLKTTSSPADAFPPDERAFGFDTSGAVQTTTLLHVERWFDAARAVIDEALAVPRRYDLRIEAEQVQVVSYFGANTGHPVDDPGYQGLMYIYDPAWVSSGTLPFEAGRYRITARAMGCLDDHWDPERRCQAPTEQSPVVMRIAAGTEPLQDFSLTGELQTYATEVTLVDGATDIRVGLLTSLRFMYLDSFLVEGPLDGPAVDPAVRDGIVVCDLEAEGIECARTIFAHFGRKAWRRPLGDDELDRLEVLVVDNVTDGASLEEAVKLGLVAVLLSPHFLYRVELDTGADAHPVTPHELAARLSYFLWRTMPDDELAALADDGSLQEADVLAAQVERMLVDVRAQTFVESMAMQWLAGDDVLTARPVGPRISPELAQSMRTELALVFTELIESEADFRTLLDADFTYVDEALAVHYGLPPDGIAGPSRISLAGSNRLGLLTMGAPLVTNASENRGSIILRGKWVLERLLCEPPAGPPGDVPVLSEPEPGQTIRQALEAHRAHPACAGCHAKMDPIGFALEHYDQTGRYRDVDEHGLAIDSSGTLPDGSSFGDALELAALLRDDPAFDVCVARHLVAYGLGHDPDQLDVCGVEALAEGLRAGNYSFRSLIRSFSTSRLFTHRRARPEQAP